MVSRTTYADLEIRILERQMQGYPVEITLNNEQQFSRGYLDPAVLDWVPTSSPAADGERLFTTLTADGKLKAAWAEVRGQHPQRRVRLRIDASAPELHALPWELLREPGDSGLPHGVAVSEATPFSRYLAGRWLPGGPILKRPIRVLVAIANPENLKSQSLEPLEVDKEWASLLAATSGLTDVKMDALPQPCTLAALEAKLKEGYHVLHFIGHGRYRKNENKAVLYMADQENQPKLEYDTDIAEMLGRQLDDTEIRRDDKLRLIFLASCQTAIQSSTEAFRGLAPMLVAAGVPAVVAMQDLMPVKSAQILAGTFYRQLLQHGQVDLATNEARSSLLSAGLPGASIPVLFMRLRSGQLFGERGKILGDRAPSFWNTLLGNIADGDCVPFLGPGVAAGLLPSPVELAEQFATKYNYPFPVTQSWPRIAQFVGTGDNSRLRKETIRVLISGFKSAVGLKDADTRQDRSLCEIIEEVNWPDSTHDLFENEIHHQLADLELPLYMTTNFDNFMALALKAKHAPARRETVKWQEMVRRDAGRPHRDLDPPPSRENPVVMHLFGTDDDPLSMVLTEDDYLDYLTRISRDYEYLVPTNVQEKLNDKTLLFLGYHLEDLDLKVLMRGLLTNLNLQRYGRLHVAVQIESSIVDQAKHEEVTHYFQKYFSSSKIDVYWGNTHQFVADLHARWQEYEHA